MRFDSRDCEPDANERPSLPAHVASGERKGEQRDRNRLTHEVRDCCRDRREDEIQHDAGHTDNWNERGDGERHCGDRQQHVNNRGDGEWKHAQRCERQQRRWRQRRRQSDALHYRRFLRRTCVAFTGT
jgi:hypothetical protein